MVAFVRKRSVRRIRSKKFGKDHYKVKNDKTDERDYGYRACFYIVEKLFHALLFSIPDTGVYKSKCNVS